MHVRAPLNTSRFQILSDQTFGAALSLTTTTFAVTASTTVRVVPYLQCGRTDGRHDCCRPVRTAVSVLTNVFCNGCRAVSHVGVAEQICIENDLTLVIYCLIFRSFPL